MGGRAEAPSRRASNTAGIFRAVHDHTVAQAPAIGDPASAQSAARAADRGACHAPCPRSQLHCSLRHASRPAQAHGVVESPRRGRRRARGCAATRPWPGSRGRRSARPRTPAPARRSAGDAGLGAVESRESRLIPTREGHDATIQLTSTFLRNHKVSAASPSLRKPNSLDLSRRLRVLESRSYLQPLLQAASVVFQRNM